MALVLHEKLAVIVVDEETSWEVILQESGLRRHLIKELSTRAVVFEPAGVEALLAWLKKRGYLPKVVG